MFEALTMWPLYMSPILFFGVIFLWWPSVLIIFFVVRRFVIHPWADRKRQLWKYFCFFLAFLPWYDVLLLSYGFNYLCATKQGEIIYHTVDEVDGFLVYESESSAGRFLDRGYRYVETIDNGQEPRRLTLQGFENSELFKAVVDEDTQAKWLEEEYQEYLTIESIKPENIKAEYEYLMERNKLLSGAYLEVVDQVRSRVSGEIQGLYKSYFFKGGYLDREYIGGTGTCPNKVEKFRSWRFVERILKPINYF